nr:MAG TPA: UPF0230 protein [Caudoviricetes sp.]
MSKRYTVLVLHLPSTMSQTYNNAILGKHTSKNIIIILGFTYYRKS